MTSEEAPQLDASSQRKSLASGSSVSAESVPGPDAPHMNTPTTPPRAHHKSAMFTLKAPRLSVDTSYTTPPRVMTTPKGTPSKFEPLNRLPTLKLSLANMNTIHSDMTLNPYQLAAGAHVGSPLTQRNWTHIKGLLGRATLEEYKNSFVSPQSISSPSSQVSGASSTSRMMAEGSPMGGVPRRASLLSPTHEAKLFSPMLRPLGHQSALGDLTPQLQRVTDSLEKIGLHVHHHRSSAPCTPGSSLLTRMPYQRKVGSCINFTTRYLVPSPGNLRPTAGDALLIDAAVPEDQEEMVPEEVPILLMQMNSSSQFVNDAENELRACRQMINKLDNNWKTMRERLISSIGATYIQRADPYYTKLREIQYKKDLCSKLAQKFAHLSTLVDQMDVKVVETEREKRWLEIRKTKASRIKSEVEIQMRKATDAVARLQQELSTYCQDNATSVKKAEHFFSEYGTYLENRKKSMQEQREIEARVTENKELYKAAMDGLELLSRRIHEERGTLQTAIKA